MLIHEQESYAILGGCFTVYTEKGCGFTEPIYQECLDIEFAHLGLPFSAQPMLSLSYREKPLKHRFVPDFICYEKIILEIKAVSTLTDEHRAQLLNYLNATGLELGLLVNFGHYPKIQHERIANTRSKKSAPGSLS
ncbi:MAG TPA: GxxExxY protein [Opitutaceae bacterium]